MQPFLTYPPLPPYGRPGCLPQSEHPDALVPHKGLHVGAKYETDITGSCEAGMEAVCVKRSQSLFESPDVSTTRADEGEEGEGEGRGDGRARSCR